MSALQRPSASLLAHTELLRVEHLPKDILEHFFPVTLGVYNSAYLFITTPNYTFNQLFTAPGVRNDTTGFPDPTGETDRVFRHHDHRREWTEDEWAEWCMKGAREWGYDLVLGSLGVQAETDPWGRDAQAGRASLTAAFTRKATPPRARKRALAEARRRMADPHELAGRFTYPACASAGQPSSDTEILEAVQKVYWEEGQTWVEDVWQLDAVSRACGGMPTALFGAIDRSPNGEYQLIRQDKPAKHRWKERFWSWTIVWHDWTEPKPPTPQPTVTWMDEEEEEWGREEMHSREALESSTETLPNDWGNSSPTWGWKNHDTSQNGGWGTQSTDPGWGKPPSGWGEDPNLNGGWGGEGAWTDALPKAGGDGT